MNLVPTVRTRNLADQLIQNVIRQDSTGIDAVLNHVDRLDKTGDQLYALLGVILTQVRINYRAGRPRVDITLTEEQRRAAHTAYARGERDPWTWDGERQYQRAKKRVERSAP